MNAMDEKPGNEGDPKIAIGTFDCTTYYLLEGEEFLREMLLADGDFPRPVGCIRFSSWDYFQSVVGEDISVSDLWQINSAIVDRLRKENDLLEIDAPDT